jgi:hypothetical protein
VTVDKELLEQLVDDARCLRLDPDFGGSVADRELVERYEALLNTLPSALNVTQHRFSGPGGAGVAIEFPDGSSVEVFHPTKYDIDAGYVPDVVSVAPDRSRHATPYKQFTTPTEAP